MEGQAADQSSKNRAMAVYPTPIVISATRRALRVFDLRIAASISINFDARKIVNTDPPNPVFAFNQDNQLLPKPSQIY